MSAETPQRPLVIGRVRITGLAGPAPSAEAVRHALAEAFRTGAEPAGATREPLKPGATLDDAARRVAAIARERSE
jgi:hypothetical protein